jgi:hypothetical protein
MSGGRTDPWPQAKKDLLIELWPNHSGLEIATIMGTTRGAILGMVNRMDLPKKTLGFRQGRPRKPKPERALKVVPPEPEPIRGPIPLLEAGLHDCRAIIGSTDGPNGLATVCGKRIVEGSAFSFCAEHTKLYVQRSTRG